MLQKPKKKINFLILAIASILPFYLVRFSVFEIPTNITEAAILIAFFLWLGSFKKTSPLFSLPVFFWISAGLLFSGLFISSLSGGISFRELGIIKGWFVIPFLFFLMVVDQVNSLEKIERVLKFFYVSASGLGVLGLFYLWTGKITFDGRLQLIYLSPNHLAMFLVPAIIFGIFFILKIMLTTKKYDYAFYLMLSGLIMLAINLYATFSYAAWLALFLSLILTFGLTNFLNRSQKTNLFLFTLALAALSLAFQLSTPKMENLLNSNPRSSFASRVMIWKSAFKIGTDHFFQGIGPGNFQDKYLEYQKYFPPYLEWAVPHPHNLFFAFWLQGGMVGLLGFLGLLGIWLKQMIQALQKEKNSFLEATLLAIVFYILIHGIFDTTYWKNDLAIFFWLIIALGFVFVQKVDSIQMAIHSVDKK